MTDYRVVSRQVRYWRGNIHKWSMVWPLSGSLSVADYPTVIARVSELVQGVCYHGAGRTDGGLWETVLYDQATGGVPISVVHYFDPDDPGAWVPYDGGAWATTGVTILTAAETALQVEWQGGFSRTGKPVYFRKWFHSVPDTARIPPAGDVNAADITSLETFIGAKSAQIAALGAPIGRGGRLAGTSPTVNPFYGNHQMPRGRRKAPTRISSSVVGLPPGLLVVPGSDGSLES